MTTTAAQIVARVRADGMQSFLRQMKQGESAVSRFGAAGKGLSTTATLLSSALIGAAAGLGLFGAAASKAAADIESLQLGLKAVLGTTSAASMEFQRLRDIARLPGLNLEDAVGGFLKLTSAGMGIAQSERALRAFGNALASVGGGKEQLNGVLLALSQIATTEFLQGDELRQLEEHLPQVRQVLMQAFGTSRSEDLKAAGITSTQVIEALVQGLEKIPTVAGGAKNAFENFGDTVKIALAASGEGINTILIPALGKVTQFIEFLTDSGFLKSFGESLASAGKMIVSAFGGEDGILRIASTFMAVLEKVPGLVSNTFVAVVSLAESTADAIAQVMNTMLLVLDPIISSIEFAVNAVRGLMGQDAIKIPRTVQEIGRAFLNNFPHAAFPTIFQPGMLDDIGSRSDELFNKFKIYQKDGPPAPPSLESVMGASQTTKYFNEPLMNAVGAANATERNTRRTAEATERILDLNRASFGGGELGRIGVTPVEFAGYRNRQNVQVTVKLQPGMSLEQMIAVGAEQAILDYARHSGGRR